MKRIFIVSLILVPTFFCGMEKKCKEVNEGTFIQRSPRSRRSFHQQEVLDRTLVDSSPTRTHPHIVRARTASQEKLTPRDGSPIVRARAQSQESLRFIQEENPPHLKQNPQK